MSCGLFGSIRTSSLSKRERNAAFISSPIRSGVHRLRRFGSQLQRRHPHFDVFDLDSLGGVIKDCLCRPNLDGCGCVRIYHRLEQSGSRRRGSLLEARDGLAERGTARLPVLSLEFGHFEPTQKGIGPDAGGFRGFLDVPLGKQRRDGLFLLAAEFSTGSAHFPPISTIWAEPPNLLISGELPSARRTSPILRRCRFAKQLPCVSSSS